MTRKPSAMEQLVHFYTFRYSGGMLTDTQIKALEKMEQIAAQKLEQFHKDKGRENVGWMDDFQKLSCVAGHVRYLKENHTNPFAKSSIEGSLETLRDIAKRFKFDLSQSSTEK